MTEAAKLLRDIATLRESMRLDWRDLADLRLQPGEQAAIIEHIGHCMAEMEQLKRTLNQLGGSPPNR